MHPALRKGSLFTKHPAFFTSLQKNAPPFHFLPTGLSDAVAGFSVEWSTTLACSVRLPQSLGITTPSHLALRRAALSCITSVSQWTPYGKSRTCLVTSRR